MASTYTVNLGIEKIGTGEQSGTWGTTTNTNFDLIDQAVNGAVAVTLASAGTSGSPNTLAITNGAASDGRNKFIEFNDGGDLGATAYVQLDPNDAEKIVHMRNSLSGGRSVIVFQGTYNASNDFEIPNGKDVVLKFDGGGATATVTQVFEDLLVTAVAATTVDTTNIEVTNLKAKDGTSAGSIADSTGVVTLASSVLTTTDINGGSVDGVTLGTNSAVTEAQIDNININGNTISSTDTNGNVTITPDGTGSVAISKIDVAGGEIDGTAIGANSASTAVFTDLTASGTVSFSGATVSDGGTVTTVNIDGGNIDGTVIGAATPAAGSFTTGQFGTSVNVDGTVTADGLTVDGNVVFNTDQVNISDNIPKLVFTDTDTATIASITGNSSNLVYDTASSARDHTFSQAGSVRLEINSTGIDVTGTVSATTALEVSSGVPYIDWTDTATTDEDTRAITFNGDFYIGTINDAKTTTKKRFLIDHSTGDISFYEDTGTTPKFFWDASAESLGIGTASPEQKLHVAGGDVLISITNSVGASLIFENNAADQFSADKNYHEIDFITSTTSSETTGGFARIRAGQEVSGGDNRSFLGFWTAPDDGTATEKMRITSAGLVGIGTDSPLSALTAVSGSAADEIVLTVGNDYSAADAAGDAAGLMFQLYRSYASSLNDAAFVKAVKEQAWDASGDRDSALTFGTRSGGTEPVEHMRITSAGNVGIGTSSPTVFSGFKTLHLKNTSGNAIFLAETSGGIIGEVQANDDGGVLKFGSRSNTPVVFTQNDTERARIDSSGNVGIGTSTTTAIRLTATTATANHIGLQVENSNTADSFGMVVKAGNDANDYTADFRKRDNTTIMRIRGDGNVGIGTTSPASRLHINSAADTVLTIGTTNATADGRINFRNSAGTDIGRIWYNTSGDRMMFYTGSTERARIDSSGNLLVGDTTASAKLWVNKSDNGNAFGARATSATYAATVGFFGADRNTTNNSFYYIDCYNYGSSTYRFRVADSGDATNTNNSYGAISDAKLKENITDASPKLDKLNKVRVVNYNFIGEDRKQLGVIAQELEQVFPGMVDEIPDRDADGNDLGTTTKSVKYSVFVPMLIKAMQEQQEIINDLRARVAQLEGA